MKTLVTLLFVCLTPCAALLAQDRTATEEREIQRQELVNLEQQNAHAIQLNSSTFFNATYADDFLGVTWYGEVINKAQQIRNIQNSSTTYDFVRCTDVQVKMYLDTASVSSLLTERGSARGQQLNRQFRVLRVYINTPRGWRVVAQQETQLPTQVTR